MSETDHPLAGRYPELRRFGSRAEASAAIKACQKEQMKTLRFWIILLLFTLCVGITVAAAILLVRKWVPVSGATFGGLVGGITGGSGVVVLQWFWRHEFRTLLRKRLISSGVPICLKCGYDLRGQIESRCPECGTPFDGKLLVGTG